MADKPEFADRLATYDMSNAGNQITLVKDNFFTFDFTVAELKTLRRIQVNPDRDPSYNGLFTFVTFDEFVRVAKTKGVGIAPEIKSPSALNKVRTFVTIYANQDLDFLVTFFLGLTRFITRVIVICNAHKLLSPLLKDFKRPRDRENRGRFGPGKPGKPRVHHFPVTLSTAVLRNASDTGPTKPHKCQTLVSNQSTGSGG